MSKHKEILSSLNRIREYTAEDMCRTLSLALDIPELFNISNPSLLEALRTYEGMLEFNNVSHNNISDEEEESDY